MFDANLKNNNVNNVNNNINNNVNNINNISKNNIKNVNNNVNNDVNKNNLITPLQYIKMTNNKYFYNRMSDDEILKERYNNYLFKNSISFETYKKDKLKPRTLEEFNKELLQKKRVADAISSGKNKVLKELYDRMEAGADVDELDFKYDLKDSKELFNKILDTSKEVGKGVKDSISTIYHNTIDVYDDFYSYRLNKYKELQELYNNNNIDVNNNNNNNVFNENNLKYNKIDFAISKRLNDFFKENITSKEIYNASIKFYTGEKLDKEEQKAFDEFQENLKKQKESTSTKRITEGIVGGVGSTATYMVLNSILGTDNPIYMTLGMPIRTYNEYYNSLQEKATNIYNHLKVAENNGDIQISTELKNNLEKLKNNSFSLGDFYKSLGRTFIGNVAEKYFGDVMEKYSRRLLIKIGGRKIATNILKGITRETAKLGISGMYGETWEDILETPLETALFMNYRNDNLKYSDNKLLQYTRNILGDAVGSVYDVENKKLNIEGLLTTFGSVYINNFLSNKLLNINNFLDNNKVNQEDKQVFFETWNNGDADTKKQLEEKVRNKQIELNIKHFNQEFEKKKQDLKNDLLFNNDTDKITEKDIDNSFYLLKNSILYISDLTGIDANKILNKWNVEVKDNKEVLNIDVKKEIIDIQNKMIENNKNKIKELEKDNKNNLKEKEKEIKELENKVKELEKDNKKLENENNTRYLNIDENLKKELEDKTNIKLITIDNEIDNKLKELNTDATNYIEYIRNKKEFSLDDAIKLYKDLKPLINYKIKAPSAEEFIISKGGIYDDGGDLSNYSSKEYKKGITKKVKKDKNNSRSLFIDNKKLFSNDGKYSIDDMFQLLVEYKYFPDIQDYRDYTGNPADKIQEAIDNNYYSLKDEDELLKYEENQKKLEDIESAGVDISLLKEIYDLEGLRKYKNKVDKKYINVLYQDISQEKKIKGQYDTTKKLITLFRNEADGSTIVHELAHWYKDILKDFNINDDLYIIDKFLNQKVKKKEGQSIKDYEIEKEEYFARSFETYLIDNKNFFNDYQDKNTLEKIKDIFEDIKEMMLRVYKSVLDLGVHLTPSIENYFNKVFKQDFEIEKTTERTYDLNKYYKTINQALVKDGIIKEDHKYDRDYLIDVNNLDNDKILFENEREKEKTRREKIIEEMGGADTNTKINTDNKDLTEEQRINKIKEDFEYRSKKSIFNNIVDVASRSLRTTGDIIKGIDEKLYTRLRETIARTKIRTNDYKRRVKTFTDFLNKLQKENKKDYVYLSVALFNSDINTIKSILNKYNQLDSYLDTREVIQEIAEELKTVQPSFEDKIKNYFPRVLKMDVIREGEAEDVNVIQEKIKEFENKKGTKLTEEQKEKFVNNLIKGNYINDIYIKDTTGNITKKRINKEVNVNNAKYYETPQVAIQKMLENEIQFIEGKKFFGGIDKSTRDLMKKLNLKQTQMKKLIDSNNLIENNKDNQDLYKKSLEKIYNKQLEIDDLINQIGTNENLENSIGRLLLDKKDKLTTEDYNLLRDSLKVIFNPTPSKTNIIAKTIKGTAPMLTMISIKNGLKQLKEISNVFYNQGVDNTLKTMFEKSRIGLKDLGLKDIDLTNKSKINALLINNFFDKTSKVWNIKANIEKMKNLIKNKDLNFENKLKFIFGDRSENVKSDIMTENKKSLDLRTLLYIDMSEMQPLDNLDLTYNYLNSPTARLFYTLKSYTIKTLNFKYNLIKKLWNDGDKKGAFKQLGKYAVNYIFLTSLGVAGARLLLSSMMKDSDIDEIITDEVIDSILDFIHYQDAKFLGKNVDTSSMPLFNLLYDTKNLIIKKDKGKNLKKIYQKYGPFGKDWKYIEDLYKKRKEKKKY